MKDFDDIFRRKVKEAFDSYNVDHLAEEGWTAYVRKHGRERRRALIFPFWARAASVAVLVTSGVLLINHLNNRQPVEPADPTARLSTVEITDSTLLREDTASAVTASLDPDKASGPAISSSGHDQQSVLDKTGTRIGGKAGPSPAENALIAAAHPPEAVPADGPIDSDTSTAYESIRSGTLIAAGTDPGVNLDVNPSEIRLTDDTDARLNLLPKKVLQEYPDLPREKMTTSLMTGFSGMMASIDNAATTATGVSLGFYVERQLTRRISIRPGLAMAKHSYGMESSPGEYLSGGDMALEYSAPELDGLSGEITSYEADIEVISMEVPVNFVFSLRKRAGTNLFVSTGASTVIYLKQRLSGNFNNTYTKTNVDSNTGDTFYASMTTTVKIESDQELFSHVDLLGLANFSAGYSFPFAGSSQLVLEPFVQLPIRDLTSLNLRIRYGGLSMKIRF